MLAKAAIAELKGDFAGLADELPGIKAGLAKCLDQSRVPVIRSWLEAWSNKVAVRD